MLISSSESRPERFNSSSAHHEIPQATPRGERIAPRSNANSWPAPAFRMPIPARQSERASTRGAAIPSMSSTTWSGKVSACSLSEGDATLPIDGSTEGEVSPRS